MKRSARITLKKETLTALTGDDLNAVAGGASAVSCYTCIQLRCLVEFSPSVIVVTNCCEGIPTFHRAAC